MSFGKMASLLAALVALTAGAVAAGGPPCSACGPGHHWVDSCAGGQDSIYCQAAEVGIDLNLDCYEDLSLLMWPCPLSVLVVNRSEPRDTSHIFPGVGEYDGHLDVIDTEMIQMCLTGGGLTLRAGSGQGQCGCLLPSLGAIVEHPDSDSIANSFFDVFFEIDMGGGMYLYNHEAFRVEGIVDCAPPEARYIHTSGCLWLYTHPHPDSGMHVANLVRAVHAVNTASVPSSQSAATGFSLAQNHPNPFRGTTEIRYWLRGEAGVNLSVYGVRGEKVRTLVDRHQTPGDMVVRWDGRDDKGIEVSDGIYFYKLQVGGHSEIRKMTLLR